MAQGTLQMELIKDFKTLEYPGVPSEVRGLLKEKRGKQESEELPRTLEWVAISFFNAWKWKNKVKLLSRVRLLVTPWTAAHQAPPSMGFSRQEYWSGVPLPSPVTTEADVKVVQPQIKECSV